MNFLTPFAFAFAAAIPVVILFYLLNSRFIMFLASIRGLRFALASCLLLATDALVVGLGMLLAVADLARGRRY